MPGLFSGCLAIPSIVPKFVWLGTDVHAHADDLFRITRADDRGVLARKLCELRKIARNSGIYEALYYLHVALYSPSRLFIYIHIDYDYVCYSYRCLIEIEIKLDCIAASNCVIIYKLYNG